jgi:hypothetical protein
VDFVQITKSLKNHSKVEWQLSNISCSFGLHGIYEEKKTVPVKAKINEIHPQGCKRKSGRRNQIARN